MAVVLASQSPRRRQLLEQVGLKFTTMTSYVSEENCQENSPQAIAVALARDKAQKVAASLSSDDVVIGADTIVVLDGDVFGKPVDTADAKQMLARLSGREHQVITGVAVIKGARVLTDYAVTIVRFRPLSAIEIEAYLATGESADKAGAYGIQGIGALLVDKIEGCYANVVGLPLVTLAELLKRVDVRLL